jgi:hypothetical protein
MRKVTAFATVLALVALHVIACGEDEPIDVTGRYSVDYESDFASDSMDFTDYLVCPGTITIVEQTGGDFSGAFTAIGLVCESVTGSTFTGTVESNGDITSPDLFEEFFDLESQNCVLSDGTTELQGRLSGVWLTLQTTVEFLCEDASGFHDAWFDFQVSGIRDEP